MPLAIVLLVACQIGLCEVAEPEGPPALSQEDATKGGAVKLTRPDGTPIYVNPHAIAFIRGPLPGEGGHTTLVFTSGAKQTVVETPKQIMDIWEKERLPVPVPPVIPPTEGAH